MDFGNEEEGDYVRVDACWTGKKDVERGAVAVSNVDRNSQSNLLRSLSSSRGLEFRRAKSADPGDDLFAQNSSSLLTCGTSKPSSSACTIFKYVYSMGLLLLSTVIVVALILQRKTKLSQDWSPLAAMCTMIFAIVWLNMVEGTQGSFVGLPPVDPTIYETSHPLTHKCTTLAHRGDNLDRFIIGRQFLVVGIVFCTNFAGAPHHAETTVLGLPNWLQEIFLDSGVAMILMTAMAGQLNSQVNASQCMLDYANNYFALFTLYVAMAIEWSGLLHSVYLIQILFSKVTGQSVESNEPARAGFQRVWFWARVLLSIVLLTLSFFVTLIALWRGQTTMWEGTPKVLGVVLFFLLMSVVGMLEGMQIAFFAVAKLPPSERSGQHPCAIKTCKLLFEENGNNASNDNLARFMIGRQICVTMCFFVIARITSLDINFGDATFLGVSDGVQEFLNTGLLGALVTTIVGSIAWQLVASSFPISFLSNPLVYGLLRCCLLLESSGVCAGAWVLAELHKRIAGFQKDEVYLEPQRRGPSTGVRTCNGNALIY